MAEETDAYYTTGTHEKVMNRLLLCSTINTINTAVLVGTGAWSVQSGGQ